MTVLRLVRAAPPPQPRTPGVLGVDDWSWHKGRTYGTLLVDLKRYCPVDLLPDRTAEAFAARLTAHPGVEIISRDRGGAYMAEHRCSNYLNNNRLERDHGPETLWVKQGVRLMCGFKYGLQSLRDRCPVNHGW